MSLSSGPREASCIVTSQMARRFSLGNILDGAIRGLDSGSGGRDLSEGGEVGGRKGHEDAVADAALLMRAAGRPVRMQWMRADEHGWDPKGPHRPAWRARR